MENVVLGGWHCYLEGKSSPKTGRLNLFIFFVFREVGIAPVAGAVLDTGQYHGDLCGAQDICWQLTSL